MICKVKRRMKKADFISELAGLAFGGCNDAVKLLFIDPDDGGGGVDGLDLRHVSEMKRAANGAVEIRLVNRLELLRLLAEQVDGETSAAESLVSALDRAAGALGGGERED